MRRFALLLVCVVIGSILSLKTYNSDVTTEKRILKTFVDQPELFKHSVTQVVQDEIPELIRTADENSIDIFDAAQILHQKALAGDISSQYKLGNILRTCFQVAESREQITHNLDLLYVYRNSLPNDVLTKIEQLITQCSDFKPENFYLFNPIDDADLNFFVFNESDFETVVMLGYYWLSKAANAGHLDALISILGLPLLPPMSVDIDKPGLVEALDNQLMLANPNLLASLSSCILEPISNVKTALIDSACSATKNCRELLRYDLLLLTQLERVHVAPSDEEATISKTIENNVSYVDLVKLIEDWKKAEPESLEYQKTFLSSLNDKHFRQSLIENCTKIMNY
jgi:hypothetical protein